MCAESNQQSKPFDVTNLPILCIMFEKYAGFFAIMKRSGIEEITTLLILRNLKARDGNND